MVKIKNSRKITHINVFYHGKPVGTLAMYDKVKTAFQYDPSWIKQGFALNPLKLPLSDRVFIASTDPFEGLFGVFYGSLPDGWGRLLVDRMLIKHGIEPDSLNILERLAIVGSSGMGALTYEPDYTEKSLFSERSLDYYAEQCKIILSSMDSEDLDGIYALGGSSGGARPKVLVDIEGTDWIVKFSSFYDISESGLMEYEYNCCASKCGIEIPKVKLFPSTKCRGYFASLRFDRTQNQCGKKDENTGNRVHMLTASALLDVSHRIPALDYNSLMQLTLYLTHDYRQLEEMYKRMCFNVFAHNRDDHSNNFSFLFNKNIGWKLSPAYDLTYSNSLNGEHATCVNGNGINPDIDDIYAVAQRIGLNSRWAKSTALEIRDTVRENLKDYLP